MKKKKKLSRNKCLAITLVALLILTLITGSVAVYGMYTKTHSGGSGVSVRVEPSSQSKLVEKSYVTGDYNFTEIPAVFPFG